MLHLIKCPPSCEAGKKKKVARFMDEEIQEVLVTSPSFQM